MSEQRQHDGAGRPLCFVCGQPQTAHDGGNECNPPEGYEVVPAGVLAERDRYRTALRRIADAESGTWGWIAHDALRGKAA